MPSPGGLDWGRAIEGRLPQVARILSRRSWERVPRPRPWSGRGGYSRTARCSPCAPPGQRLSSSPAWTRPRARWLFWSSAPASRCWWMFHPSPGWRWRARPHGQGLPSPRGRCPGPPGSPGISGPRSHGWCPGRSRPGSRPWYTWPGSLLSLRRS